MPRRTLKLPVRPGVESERNPKRPPVRGGGPRLRPPAPAKAGGTPEQAPARKKPAGMGGQASASGSRAPRPPAAPKRGAAETPARARPPAGPKGRFAETAARDRPPAGPKGRSAGTPARGRPPAAPKGGSADASARARPPAVPGGRAGGTAARALPPRRGADAVPPRAVRPAAKADRRPGAPPPARARVAPGGEPAPPPRGEAGALPEGRGRAARTGEAPAPPRRAPGTPSAKERFYGKGRAAGGAELASPRAAGAGERRAAPRKPGAGPAETVFRRDVRGGDERSVRPRATGELPRVSKLMSERGMCSRREADEWIENGWVRADGRLVTLGTRVHPQALIEVDPKAAKHQSEAVTILLHKPVGYVSGQAEEGYRPAVTLVRPETRWAEDDPRRAFKPGHLRGLAPAGRLDIDSTGLLVLTQDGRIARMLVGEDSKVEKEYLVRVEGELDAAGLALLGHGLALDGMPLKPAKVSWQNEDQLRFVLREGRKRQIRRMCELVGLRVTGLKRIRIGSVSLGRLPPGQWRYLRPDEKF